MRITVATLLPALVPAVWAAPPNFCKDVNIIVNLLKLQKATPFCSSFIKVPLATKTAPVTVATNTVYTSTTTLIIPQTSTVTSIRSAVTSWFGVNSVGLAILTFAPAP